MPFYEYRCQACGEYLESLQKLSDPPLVDCPACGKPELKKQVSAAGFRLKGGGWYETDFKNDKKRNLHGDGAKTPDKTSSGDTAASPAAKPESKPAAPADSGKTTTSS
jgi:putative FmdB family regulatory protein